MTHPLHEKAVYHAQNIRTSEKALLEVLEKIENEKIYSRLGYGSLWAYVTLCLKFSEGEAGRLIGVMRKAREIPELKAAVVSKGLTLSKAARVLPVIRKDNADAWISEAKTLSYKELEKKVAVESPKSQVREKVKPIGEEAFELRALLSSQAEAKLKRAGDLLSQKHRKSLKIGEVIEALLEEYLKNNDPFEKPAALPVRVAAARADSGVKAQPRVVTTKTVPRPTARAVLQQNGAKCAAKNPDGSRCEATRFLEIHHIRPKSQGGSHEIENLTLLCKGHHHERHPWATPSRVGYRR